VANHASAEKRNRQRIKRTLRNRAVKSTVRTVVKKARTAIGAIEGAVTEATVKTAISALDKAAKAGVIHPNKSARTIARLSKQLHAAKAAPKA
jgi:small subunit ribosomal protein S20